MGMRKAPRAVRQGERQPVMIEGWRPGWLFSIPQAGAKQQPARQAKQAGNQQPHRQARVRDGEREDRLVAVLQGPERLEDVLDVVAGAVALWGRPELGHLWVVENLSGQLQNERLRHLRRWAAKAQRQSGEEWGSCAWRNRFAAALLRRQLCCPFTVLLVSGCPPPSDARAPSRALPSAGRTCGGCGWRPRPCTSW